MLVFAVSWSPPCAHGGHLSAKKKSAAAQGNSPHKRSFFFHMLNLNIVGKMFTKRLDVKLLYAWISRLQKWIYHVVIKHVYWKSPFKSSENPLQMVDLPVFHVCQRVTVHCIYQIEHKTHACREGIAICHEGSRFWFTAAPLLGQVPLKCLNAEKNEGAATFGLKDGS